MNNNYFEILEYNKIKELLSSYTQTELGKEKAKKLAPVPNMRAINDLLTETQEAVSVITYKGKFPIGDVKEIISIVSLLEKRKTLAIRDFILIKDLINISNTLKDFLSINTLDIEHINEIKNLIIVPKSLKKEIEKVVASEDEINDNASKTLNKIRNAIKEKNSSIRLKLQNIISTKNSSNHLQDDIITLRNGRYVIPVKKEYVKTVSGIIHDKSKTGSTLFVEPEVIVNLNNELRELLIEEEKEIERILRELSKLAGIESKNLLNNYNLIGELDFINAKGEYALSIDAYRPQIVNSGIIDLKAARHPLIESKKVVPININIGETFSTLLITGPNTGGKTATLKTVGLLVLMAMSGLFVPCDKKSIISIFDEVFADIGDEQSIEQNLSTFSGHMKNIIYITKNMSQNSLILLDEPGAGTDPAEGTALSIAELEYMRKTGAKVIATTHYNEMKRYGLITDGVETASMDFDEETLRPTYKLRMGYIGNSNAFHIAKALGIREEILNEAEKIIDVNQTNFNDAINITEEKISNMEKLNEEAREYRENAKSILENAKKEAEKILEESKKNSDKLKEQAKDNLLYTNELLKQAKRALKNSENTTYKDNVRIKNQINSINAKRRSISLENESLQSNKNHKIKASDITIGSNVLILSLNKTGKVMTIPDERENVTIKIGSLKMNLHISDLKIIKNNSAKQKGNSRGGIYNMRYNKIKSINTEIKLIGKNLEDARIELEKYLDDAVIAGLKQVRIIHGRGEKILQKGLRDILEKNENIEGYEFAPYNQGGDGVTIVKLKGR